MIPSRLIRFVASLGLAILASAQLYAQAEQEPSHAEPTSTALPSEHYPSLAEEVLSFSISKEDSLALAKSKARTEAYSWKPSSKKALLWALIPGGGQIYNRKYWKLPIVWGGLMTCGYFIAFNNRMYQEYHAAYRDLSSADPSVNTAWLAFAPSGTRPEDHAQHANLKNTLQRGNDYYRRYRDLSIVLAIGIYGLSILDAYVDAELFTFDISPDLSMRVAPAVMPKAPNYSNGYQLGLGCQLTF